MFKTKVLGWCGALTLVGSLCVSAGSADAASYVHLLISHVNDEDAGLLGYRATMEVQMDDPAATVVVTDDGTDIGLAQDPFDPTYWQAENPAPNLADLLADLQGNYQITATTGSGTSTMNFTVGPLLATLDASSFLALPQVTSPTNGQAGVSAQPTVTWNPTADLADAHIIAVDMSGPNDDAQDVNTAIGTMNLSDTMWTPPSAFGGGHTVFTLTYGTTDGTLVPLLLTNFTQNAGTGGVVWTTSPYAPPSEYGSLPSGLPLMGLLSEHTIGFEIVPEPASATLLALAGPALLARQRRRTR